MSDDCQAELQAQVNAARAVGARLRICGSDSRGRWLRPTVDPDAGSALSVAGHRGVVAYEPAELVMTARAGTPLADIEEQLAAAGQMLASEPPRCAAGATLGGALAHGWSGPRRPWGGALRDHVLGVKLLNGRGEILRLGGQVIKNVAGYDLSRLQVGGGGTYGVILEASLKVLPVPQTEITIARSMDVGAALAVMAIWTARAVAISAMAWWEDRLLVRLAGSAAGVAETRAELPAGESISDAIWPLLRDGPVAARAGRALWRLHLPASTPHLPLDGQWCIDQGGQLRWLSTTVDDSTVRAAVAEFGGSCVPVPAAPGYRGDPLRRRLGAAFDPDGVFRGSDADSSET